MFLNGWCPLHVTRHMFCVPSINWFLSTNVTMPEAFHNGRLVSAAGTPNYIFENPYVKHYHCIRSHPFSDYCSGSAERYSIAKSNTIMTHDTQHLCVIGRVGLIWSFSNHLLLLIFLKICEYETDSFWTFRTSWFRLQRHLARIISVTFMFELYFYISIHPPTKY